MRSTRSIKLVHSQINWVGTSGVSMLRMLTVFWLPLTRICINYPESRVQPVPGCQFFVPVAGARAPPPPQQVGFALSLIHKI